MITTVAKTITPTSYTPQTVEFAGTDFQCATGYARLEGPWSLRINTDNAEYTTPAGAYNAAVYIGVDVILQGGVVRVGERAQLAFCAAGSAISISGSSVPQLARIDGIVEAIRVIVYPLATNNGLQRIRVQPVLDAPFAPVGSLAYIGSDAQALEPGGSVGVQSSTTYAGYGGGITVATPAASVGTRHRVRWCAISITPTPGAGDVIARLSRQTVTLSTYPLVAVYGDRNVVQNWGGDLNLILMPLEYVYVYTTNGASTAVTVDATISYEIIL